MRGLHIEFGELSFRDDLPEPAAPEGWSTVAVRTAGVCATDLALRRGYMGFAGVPGHEFVGVALDGPLAGRRVVGDINAACGACATCAAGDPHHCPNRSVLGILAHSGAFAERLALPDRNLLPVPDQVSDAAATMTEPLAAAFEIGTQVEIAGRRVLVAGDGRLGLLCAWAVHLDGAGEVVVAGRHAERQSMLPSGSTLCTGMLEAPPAADLRASFDVVVEATGSEAVVARALPLVRPRGTLVLKTTTEAPATLDLAPIVVDEITVVGSRCGPFDRALAALAAGSVPVERWIDARFPLAQGVAAFARAAERGVLKVLVDV